MKTLLVLLALSTLGLAGCHPDKKLYEEERKTMDRAKNVEKEAQERDKQMREKMDGEQKKTD